METSYHSRRDGRHRNTFCLKRAVSIQRDSETDRAGAQERLSRFDMAY